jgi:hypothetical protein
MRKKIPPMLLTVCIALTLAVLAAVPAYAATVNYNTGSFDNVIGNDGTGGVNTLPVNNANASGNTVNVTGGTVSNGIYGGLHYTANGDPATTGNNTVNIESSFSGHSSLDVFGGYAMVDAASGSEAGKTAAATGNTVNIAGGTFSDVVGGQASSYDGLANAGNNTVNFTGGTASNIYGGAASIGAPLSTAASTAMGNSVFISGGTVNGYVYGGYSNIGAGIGSATDNTVTISGAPTMTAAKLYGGYVDDAYTSPVSTDAFTGNTLNWNTSGLTISELGNFAVYNFTLPASIAAGGTVITASDGYGMSAIDVAGVTVGLAVNGAPSLAVGDKITLIDGGAYGVAGTPATTSLTASGRTFGIAVESGKLIATVTPPNPSPASSGGGGCDAGVGSWSPLVLAAGLTVIRMRGGKYKK